MRHISTAFQGLLSLIMLATCFSCQKEKKSGSRDEYYCKYKIDTTQYNFKFVPYSSTAAGYDYKTDTVVVFHQFLFNQTSDGTGGIYFKQYFNADEIKGCPYVIIGDWKCELTMEQIFMTIQEGYYKNIISEGYMDKKDRILVRLDYYIRTENSVTDYMHLLNFDLSVKYDTKPAEGSYFHLYDIHVINDCSFTFKADFEGISILNDSVHVPISGGELNAWYSKNESACFK